MKRVNIKIILTKWTQYLVTLMWFSFLPGDLEFKGKSSMSAID